MLGKNFFFIYTAKIYLFIKCKNPRRMSRGMNDELHVDQIYIQLFLLKPLG